MWQWHSCKFVLSLCMHSVQKNLIDQPVVSTTTMLCEVNFIGVVTELLNGISDVLNSLVDEVVISNTSVL